MRNKSFSLFRQPAELDSAPVASRKSKSITKALASSFNSRKNFSRFGKKLHKLHQGVLKLKSSSQSTTAPQDNPYLRKRKVDKTIILDLKFGSEEFIKEAKRLERNQILYGITDFVDYRHESREILSKTECNKDLQNLLFNDQRLLSQDAAWNRRSNSSAPEIISHGNRAVCAGLSRKQNSIISNCRNFNNLKSLKDKMVLDMLRERAEDDISRRKKDKEGQIESRRGNSIFSAIAGRDSLEATREKKKKRRRFKSEKVIKRRRGYLPQATSTKTKGNIGKSKQFRSVKRITKNPPLKKKGKFRSLAVVIEERNNRRDFGKFYSVNNYNKYMSNKGIDSIPTHASWNPFIDLVLLNESKDLFNSVKTISKAVKGFSSQAGPKERTGGAAINAVSKKKRGFIFKMKSKKKKRNQTQVKH